MLASIGPIRLPARPGYRYSSWRNPAPAATGAADRNGTVMRIISGSFEALVLRRQYQVNDHQRRRNANASALPSFLGILARIPLPVMARVGRQRIRYTPVPSAPLRPSKRRGAGMACRVAAFCWIKLVQLFGSTITCHRYYGGGGSSVLSWSADVLPRQLSGISRCSG